MKIKVSVNRAGNVGVLEFKSPTIRMLNDVESDGKSEIELILQLVSRGGPTIDDKPTNIDELYELDVSALADIQAALLPFFRTSRK